MKNAISLVACFFIAIVLFAYRFTYPGVTSGKPLKVTEWDAFGYYMYLPAVAIYHDVKELKWVPGIDKKYAVTGGNGVQAQKENNGNYVFKYLGGVAIMELPLFLIGHFAAGQLHYPQDGFSPPYQYALALGVIIYCILAIFLLRNMLLQYFGDAITASTLLLLCLATNFIQYAAIDNGQSHGYIFPLYALVIFSTIKWHMQPKYSWACLTGYVVGLATISRPTEAIMLFIPLMWNTHTKEHAKDKWRLVKENKGQMIAAAIFGLIGILPQLIYWKIASGSFIYDVGSKWDFLNPHFRVLFGWEKGWFIYTPVTVFFIAGMFFMKNYPFRKSVLWFCLLNIYIIIAWNDWRYGGSYSTRALVQSYPMFAFPLAAGIETISLKKWRYPVYALFLYLTLINLFQITQYCATILHYNDMNRKYYAHIYMNPNPTPKDMSLLDNDELVCDEHNFSSKLIIDNNTARQLKFDRGRDEMLFDSTLVSTANDAGKERWLKIESRIKAPGCLWQSYLHTDVGGDTVKHARVRLFSPISNDTGQNNYIFYVRIPKHFKDFTTKTYISAAGNFDGTVNQLKITELEK